MVYTVEVEIWYDGGTLSHGKFGRDWQSGWKACLKSWFPAVYVIQDEVEQGRANYRCILACHFPHGVGGLKEPPKINKIWILGYPFGSSVTGSHCLQCVVFCFFHC